MISLFILLSSYLSQIEKEVMQLENSISSFVVSIGVEKSELSMTGTVVGKNHIVTVGFIEVGEKVSIEDRFGNITKGEVIGRDPSTGIHLIKTEKDFSPPSFQTKINKGQLCYIYGNSFGCLGMIGMGFLQSPEGISFNVSVPLSPGNNGSGVFDSEGKLLGILGGKVHSPISLLYSLRTSNNFAEVIKVNYILNTVEQIKKTGVVKKAWLGVKIEKNVPLDRMGVIVKEVIKGSPAASVGIKEGDIILALNGNNISNIERLKELILIEEPGNTVVLTIIRGEKRMEVPVKLGEEKEKRLEIPLDLKIEKIIPKELIEENKEDLKEILNEKILRLSEELEELKKELEELK
ncbi:MAG: S1C family serine protease [candidate division WOR-3 bacterium]